MFRFKSRSHWAILMLSGLVLAFHADAQQAPQTPPPNPYLMGTEGFYKGPRGLTSYMPVAITESFSSLKARLSGEKARVEAEHSALLQERYDLSDRPAPGVTMDRTKPVQEGVRVKLPAGGDLGESGGDEPGPDPRPEPLSEGVLSVAASQAPGGRLCLSAFRDRRDQAARTGAT